VAGTCEYSDEPSGSKNVGKRRIYATMHSILRGASGYQEMCITKLWPQANWKIVWKNLHDTPVPKSSRAAWYRVIHDIIPMNDRLHRIRLTPTGNCRICDKKDTLKHRIVDSGEGKMMWTWTKQQLAQMLRTVPVHIPDGWLTCPQVILWPPTIQLRIIMDDGKSNNIPHPKTMGPNVTRHHRFPKMDKMEAVTDG